MAYGTRVLNLWLGLGDLKVAATGEERPAP